MIKDWKLFLESNNRDQEILDNIKDILLLLNDSCDDIRAYIPAFIEEFGKVKVHFIIEGKIGIEEIQIISHLNSYLKSEEFNLSIPRRGTDTKFNRIEWFKELNFIVQVREGDVYNYSLSEIMRLLSMENSIFNRKPMYNLVRIDFAYYVPDHLIGNIFKIGESGKDLIRIYG